MENYSIKLKNKTAGIVGCGGLGCYVIEFLSRLNIGKLKIIDEDVFKESNLNRQLYSKYSNLGKYKVDVAKKRVAEKSATHVITVKDRLTKYNIDKFLKDIDVAVDCTDNIESRFLLQEKCREHNIPLVHGAIDEMYGHVTTILPGDDTLHRIYHREKSMQSKTVSFAPPLIASVEASETLKVLINSSDILSKKVFYMNLETNLFFVEDLSQEK